MSKKQFTFAGFGEVVSDSNKNSDIDNIFGGKKTKEDTHIFKGYYLENEVTNAIDRITEGKPKGKKSDFVNQLIKNYLLIN